MIFLRIVKILACLCSFYTFVVNAEENPLQLTPVTDAMLQAPDPADWLMWRRTLNSWGYSPLNQINPDNVKNLKQVWQRPLGDVPGFQEGTPLVHDGIMFMPSPGDEIQAMNAATGELLWEYKRDLPKDLRQHMFAAFTNRNLAIYNNLIINTSGDDYLFALDVATGELVYETQILDFRKNPAQQTSGPIIANGKVISGRGCAVRTGPVACVITAHDANTGKELWRTRTIQKPDEDEEDSWGGVPYQERSHVGTWMIPSYDPELDLIYIGTSVTSPAPKILLAGNDKDYLYHNSTLALNADTGTINWYYQHLVDHWDMDHPFERVLVDTAVTPDTGSVSWINPAIKPGEKRKVMTGVPGKTGVVYTLDRETGEFLWAIETIKQNVVGSIDGKTGKVTVNPDALFHQEGDIRHICPSAAGGKDWQASTYSPDTNMIYVPLQNFCMTAEVKNVTEGPGSNYQLIMKERITEGTNMVGTIYAVSAETGKINWKYEQRAGTMSLFSTAGGLIFGGDAGGRFFALEQKSGELVWETNLGSVVTGYPITYAVNGKQYVAVSTGVSLATSTYISHTPELKPTGDRILFVFALPE